MICNNCGSEIDSINRFCPKCGAPVQYQAPATPPPLYSSPQSAMPPMGGPIYPPPRKSGCGKIILILAVIVVVLGAGIGAALYFGYRYTEKALKSSEPYTIALKALKENPKVKEELGEINDTGFPIGAFSSDANGSGKAAFVMSVQGSLSSGQYQVALIRNNSVWHIEQASVKTAAGDTIMVVSRRAILEDSTNDNSNTNSNRDILASGAILNDKATSLPQPVYPPIAKQAHASGAVIVQVKVDEQGNVVSALAISGHPLLRAAAVAAARQAKFEPKKVGGKAVKFSGVIKYEFVAG
jgi:TonB family protein